MLYKYINDQISTILVSDFIHGDGGSLRCLTGMADTTISHVCVHVQLTLPSILGVRSMMLVL